MNLLIFSSVIPIEISLNNNIILIKNIKIKNLTEKRKISVCIGVNFNKFMFKKCE